MRSRSRLHGILGLIEDRGYYKIQEYIKGQRPKPKSLCKVDEALLTPSGKKRRPDQITEFLQRLIDQKKEEELKAHEMVTVGDLSKRWLGYVKDQNDIETFNKYKKTIEYWNQCFKKEILVSELGVDHFAKFKKSLDHLAPRSIHHHQSQMNTFLIHSREHYNGPDIKIKNKIKVPKKTIKSYEVQEMRDIHGLILGLKNQNWQMHERIHMMLSETGMRASELLNLTWDRIRMGERKIWVEEEADWTPKAGIEGWYAMSDHLYQFLKNDQMQGKWYLDNGDSTQAYSSVSGIGHAIKRYTEKLGIKGRKVLHAYRASVAVRVYKKFGIVEAQKALRHTEESMTRQYIDDSFVDLHDVINQMDR